MINLNIHHKMVPHYTFERVKEFTVHAQLIQHERVKIFHVEKFARLRDESRDFLDSNLGAKSGSNQKGDLDLSVKNVSKRVLSEEEILVLSKGLN